MELDGIHIGVEMKKEKLKKMKQENTIFVG